MKGEKGEPHFVAADLVEMFGSRVWVNAGLAELERMLRLRAEWQQWMAERGEAE